MNLKLKKLASTLCMSTLLTVSTTRAEIPFYYAGGMLESTQNDKREVSPFWGMVALYGKMLENIRFFGNYATTVTEDLDEDGVLVRKTSDIGQDSIAVFLKSLFNSPDGVQFVATTYEGDPVGSLSRNLSAINTIIEILFESRKKVAVDPDSQAKINKLIGDQNAEKNNINQKIKAIQSKKKKYPQSATEKDKADINEENKRMDNDIDVLKKQLNSSMERIKAELNTLKEGKAKDPREQIVQLLSKISDPIKTLSPQKIQQLAVKNMRRELKNQYKDKFKDVYSDLEQKSMIEKLLEKDMGILSQSKDSKEKINELASDEIKSDIINFANLLVAAFNKEQDLANPLKPDQYFYPKNIVITSLLTYFVKVANKLSDLKKLPYLMTPEFIRIDDKTLDESHIFTVDEYRKNLEKYQLKKRQINSDLFENPETAFLMAKGFTAFEMPLSQPFNYSQAAYKEESFSDCGESSLRNILGILLSASNGGIILPHTLSNLKEYLERENPDLKLSKDSPFMIMLNFFHKNSSMSNAAISELHDQWAAIVSNLNEGQAAVSLNDIVYGRALNNKAPDVYEIKSNYDPEGKVLGIVNMFNVIAKLFPDRILNEPWNQDRNERLQQVAVKLDRFCELLSREDVEISWENDSAPDKGTRNISNEFTDINFIINGTVLKWQFLQGHFQLDSMVSTRNDWRVTYGNVDPNYFKNEWMANLFIKLNENEYLKKEDYGKMFPLSLIYNSDLKGINGVSKDISFVLYNNIYRKRLVQFTPLIERWIERSVPLNDRYSFKKISFLLYGGDTLEAVQQLLKKKKFEMIKNEVNRLNDQENENPNDFLTSILGSNTGSTLLYLVLKKSKKWSDLNLHGVEMVTDDLLSQFTGITSLSLKQNTKITDKGLINLKSLTNLNLEQNTKITDEGLSDLQILMSLNLSENNIITDGGLSKLQGLTNLNLYRNDKITDKGLENLIELTSLELDQNNTITNEGLSKLQGLRSLFLSYNTMITDEGLSKLHRLENLDLRRNDTITDGGLLMLTGLKKLDLRDNNTITDRGLVNLQNLEDLNLSDNKTITDGGVSGLTGLKRLVLSRNYKITDACIKALEERNPELKIIR